MKIRRSLICLLSLLLVLSFFTACNKDGNDTEGSADVFYTVRFNSNGGTPVEDKLVKQGGSVDEPPIPVRDGFVFDGWYDGNRQWSFSFSVDKDMTLTAKWVSSESMFEHTPAEDGKTTVITKLKKEAEEIRLPTVVGGYRVVAIGDRVFSSLNAETVFRVVVPESITSVGEEAFFNSAGVEIIIEGELSFVGEKAFHGCDGLKTVKLGGGIANIGFEAFASSGLESIDLPESLKTVDESAFDNCTSLETVFIRDSIEMIGDSAFFDTAVEVIFFYGTDDTVNDTLINKIKTRNDVLKDARIYLYSETEPTVETEFDGFFYFDKNGSTRIW